MREKIRTPGMFRVIRSATNTNILEGITEAMIRKKLKGENFHKSDDSNGRSSAELGAEDSACSFANTATENYSIHPVVHEWCAKIISFSKGDLMITALVIVGTAAPDQSEAEC